MPSFFNLFGDIFSGNKSTGGPPIQSLLKTNDFEGVYNYFIDLIRYNLSVQNSIEGFNHELNKPNWVVFMCEDLLVKINTFRGYNQKKDITLWDLFAKEEQATSQTDYPLKLALFCTELCIN